MSCVNGSIKDSKQRAHEKDCASSGDAASPPLLSKQLNSSQPTSFTILASTAKLPDVPTRKLSVIKENENELVRQDTIKDKTDDKKNKKDKVCQHEHQIKNYLKNQIDDVYDEKVVLEGYELYCLRKGASLDYMSLMELKGFSSYD